MTLSSQSYREISLSRGLVAIVDDEDYSFLSQFKWHVVWSECTNSFYAETWLYKPVKIREKMHRLLLGLHKRDGKQIDHKNGNTLDNRRENLRVVNHSQNAMNRKLLSKSASGFRGVSYCKKTGKWKSRINLGGKEIWLGRFATIDDARSAAADARIKYYGEYARDYAG